MNNKSIYILGSLLLSILVGCGGNGSGFDTAPDSGANGVETIFSADRNGDATGILDAEALGSSIDNVFGGENTEPHTMSPVDTIGDVLDRAGNV